MPDATDHPRRTRPLALWAAAAAVLVALGPGLIVIGVAAPSYRSTIVLSVGWVVLVGLVALALSRRRRGLRRVLAATFVVACAMLAAGFYWTSIRDDVVISRAGGETEERRSTERTRAASSRGEKGLMT